MLVSGICLTERKVVGAELREMALDYKLFTRDDMRDAPSDSLAKFAYIEEICRARMYEIADMSDSSALDAMLKKHYMTTVGAAAEELGVTGLPKRNSAKSLDTTEFEEFLLAAGAIVTKIHISQVGNSDSVQLAESTRTKIEKKIVKLRAIIEGGDLPLEKREALLEKLDDLAKELYERRIGLGKTMAILATVLVMSTAFLADAPNAAKTAIEIMGLIEGDREAEHKEHERLGAPPSPLAITDQTGSATPSVSKQSVFDLDEDAPF